MTLPYNLLLQKTTREALGIDLTNQVVIIDEAHNLIPTLLSLSTICLPFHVLDTSLSQVSSYLSKFRVRLSASHTLHLRRLITFLHAFRKYSAEWLAAKKENKKMDRRIEVITAVELLQRIGRKAEGVNLLEVEAYLRNSKIARKICSYSDMLAEKAAGQGRFKGSFVGRLLYMS